MSTPRTTLLTKPPGYSSNRFLHQAAFAKSTWEKYSHAVKAFYDWANRHDVSISSVDDLDAAVTDYIHELHTNYAGKCRQRAVDTVYGLVATFPRLKKRLLESEQALKGWRRLVPSDSYPPLTYALTVLIACRLVRMGFLRDAIGTLLSFDCFLRISELGSLRMCDVYESVDQKGDTSIDVMVLRLRHTKTGSNQSVIVEDPAVRTLLRLCRLTLRTGETLLNHTVDTYRRHFHRATESLGLSPRFVPHSLRHGGATRAFMEGRQMEDIMLRGRWAGAKSTRIYIQIGRALLETTFVPEMTLAASREVASRPLDAILFALRRST